MLQQEAKHLASTAQRLKEEADQTEKLATADKAALQTEQQRLKADLTVIATAATLHRVFSLIQIKVPCVAAAAVVGVVLLLLSTTRFAL